ncbi:hypothetical protein HYY69_08025 [Candidatus Woesearchaeota archaeon]|nr:hypothetical protein [Candidatus Woesearchaeota archaeon]
MEWKKIVQVSVIIGVVSYFLTFALGTYGSVTLYIRVNHLLGVIATGLVLHKMLRVKSSWGIFIGMIITGIVLTVMDMLGWLLF